MNLLADIFSAKSKLLWVVPSIFLSLFTIAIFFYFSSYGLDFTDEGYYLATIKDPNLYSSSASQFGFVYNALNYFLGNNFILLRQVNFLITLINGVV
jgi:hypothetical protein